MTKKHSIAWNAWNTVLGWSVFDDLASGEGVQGMAGKTRTFRGAGQEGVIYTTEIFDVTLCFLL